MLALGRSVSFKGRNGTVVARTFETSPRYDIRCEEGNVVKYVTEEEIDEITGWGIDPTRIVGTLGEMPVH
ncbi:hypothetical protein [Arenibaculum pallidiluteum]|uniref:hypothetical protein n=1 Tax=Arenibaculum pallidiluteum TaxID=2812559 RepID=UPI001A96ED0D|nr:hypothetical protein [Arenibaculum pallidiluteum]